MIFVLTTTPKHINIISDPNALMMIPSIMTEYAIRIEMILWSMDLLQLFTIQQALRIHIQVINPIKGI